MSVELINATIYVDDHLLKEVLQDPILNGRLDECVRHISNSEKPWMIWKWN